MNKHTSAPWKLNEDDPAIVYFSGNSMDWGICITDTKDINSLPREEALANARLIAASPDLLDALKMCEIALRYINFDGEFEGKFGVPAAQDAARAAIAKAENLTAEEVLKQEE